MSQDILKYESKVWATADLLIGAGIKQSDFPKYMMPFFALIMVESRFVRMAEELKAELEASGDILELDDGWTIISEDGSLAAHYENTILITENEPEILTLL